MQVAAMSCAACGVKVEGPYQESALNRLSPDDQQFLLDYLLSGFSIKALEENTDLGYAAIRSRDCWFYIDDRDMFSKRTFAIMQILLSLTESGEAARGPVVTIGS